MRTVFGSLALGVAALAAVAAPAERLVLPGKAVGAAALASGGAVVLGSDEGDLYLHPAAGPPVALGWTGLDGITGIRTFEPRSGVTRLLVQGGRADALELLLLELHGETLRQLWSLSELEANVGAVTLVRASYDGTSWAAIRPIVERFRVRGAEVLVGPFSRETPAWRATLRVDPPAGNPGHGFLEAVPLSESVAVVVVEGRVFVVRRAGEPRAIGLSTGGAAAFQAIPGPDGDFVLMACGRDALPLFRAAGLDWAGAPRMVRPSQVLDPSTAGFVPRGVAGWTRDELVVKGLVHGHWVVMPLRCERGTYVAGAAKALPGVSPGTAIAVRDGVVLTVGPDPSDHRTIAVTRESLPER